MTDITKPKDLLELAAAANNISQEQLAEYLKKGESLATDFNDDNAKINLDSFKNKEFTNGNYKLEGDQKKILQGAEIYAQQLIDKAEKLGMKITDFKEFKDADFNKDGKVDAKEVGALLLASSMYTKISQMGELVTEFDNKLDQREMKDLLDPKTAELAKQIAKKLLADNGVKIPDVQDGLALTKTADKAGVPRERC